MPKLPASERGSDADLDDVTPVAADAEARAQLNGELKDDVEEGAAPTGRGDIEDLDSIASESEGSEQGGQEYIVEAIHGHQLVKGKILYTIKWQGYPDDENTQEPEENLLPYARQILANYHKSIGGAPSNTLKKTKSKQSLRRQASTDESPAPSKRQKRNGTKETTVADDANETWTPTREDWEPLVVQIDTVERDESGQLLAYILFNNGKKTKVGMDKVYRHCPRPMLRFYENHLKFN